MSEFIRIGSQRIEYELVRKKVKNINLRIKPDLTVTVSAKPGVKKEYIEAFLCSKADWIEKTLRHFKECEAHKKPVRRAAEGEVLPLLGQDFIININASIYNEVQVQDNRIHIHVTDTGDLKAIDRLFSRWLDHYIRDAFYQVLEEIHSKFQDYSVPMPAVKFRSMKTRWGSCSYNKGIITLNKGLIFLPKECLEYVTAHELAHFVHPDHSRNFYRILAEVMPDYKSRMKRMKEYHGFI